MSSKTGVMLSFWGRRGAIDLLLRQAAEAALKREDLSVIVSPSRQNENFTDFASFGDVLVPIHTFNRIAELPFFPYRIFRARQYLKQELRARQVSFMIELMPHIWSPFIMSALQRTGVTYCTIIHDADDHPGDSTAWARRWSDSAITPADLVITLSRAVANKLVTSGRVDRDRIAVIPHPKLTYKTERKLPQWDGTRPLRLLFFGRIMRYKGLGLLIEAVKILRARGVRIELGVFGEGDIETYRTDLKILGAEVVNKWLTDAEVGEALSRYDAVAASHTEASQSGVVAAALAAGLPAVVTPVGALPEQVENERTGIVASEVTAAAFADATEALADADRYARIRAGIVSGQTDGSMETFIETCMENAYRHRRRQS